MTFVDRVRISVRGGDGGAGVAGFERVKGRPRGKPTGGSGGSGGAVVLEADPGAGTLLRYARQPHWRGGDGAHGEGDLRHGAHGDDVVLVVPLGTVVKDDSGTILADLVEPGQRVAVVTGGRGGKGNAGFVTPQRKAPTFAEQGEYGEARWVILELKVIADAALVGFPNVGKSTLISKVSAARPKVADYPFTTLTPHLGVVEVSGREFTLADVPGLIEGAAEGKGLGHEFLRHVERAAVLVVLLDPTPLQDRDVADQLAVLVGELASHAPDLADRPRLVAVNKIDAIDGERLGDIRRWAEEQAVALHEISAITGDGVESLLHAVADEVIRNERSAPDREGFVLHRPLGPGFVVTREGNSWVVAGRAAERAVNLQDLTSPEAAGFASERLGKIGVDRALRAAGARAGDDVRIGELTFTFDPHLAGDAAEDSA